MICALRRIPQEVAALKKGRWQSSIGTALAQGARWASTVTAASAPLRSRDTARLSA